MKAHKLIQATVKAATGGACCVLGGFAGAMALRGFFNDVHLALITGATSIGLIASSGILLKQALNDGAEGVRGEK